MNPTAEMKKTSATQKHFYPAPSDIISYGRQYIDDDDIAEVVEALKSSSLTQGPKVQEFESALCRLTGAAYAVVVNSGSAALHLACLAAGVGPGDEVITSPNTFIASANCVVYCGGKPVFADIDPRTYNISPLEIEKKINERTKAVIPVHFAGQSCDMEAIQNIVRSREKKYGHKIYIIEDACHAIGSTYKQTAVGSCAFSDMVVMSFHPVKQITAGEGGAVLTNNDEFQRQFRILRTCGLTRDVDDFTCPEDAFEEDSKTHKPIRKMWYAEQNDLGYNYRLSDIHCALGASQLKKLDHFRKERSQIVGQYNAAFKDIPGLTIPFEEGLGAIHFHIYVLLIDFEKFGTTRAQVMMELKERGIQTQVHYIPVHTQPFYRKNFGTNWGDCPVAEEYYQKCLSIPLYPAMTDGDVEKVILTIKALVGK